VVVALLNAGVPQIRLANRTRERALELARTSGDEVRVTVVAWEEAAAALDGAVLLVNTTSLGMKGNAPLSLSLNLLPRTAVVNDIVYAPLKTALLAAAEARGNGTVDGLGMLIHQARPGFEAWFGVRPEVTGELREMLERQVAS
jgi:shikimate dehydrogenase